MPKVSKRAQLTPASPIRKFLPLLLAAEKRGLQVLKLNVGDPDIAPPPAFLQTIKNYRNTQVPYAPSPGFVQHVDAWRAYYKTIGVNLQRDQILPTVGCAEAIMYAMMAVADPGDEILIFEPFYPSYRSFAEMLGIKLKAITLKLENNYAMPDRKTIAKKITKKTKAIVIINPNNPTGTILTRPERAMIVSLDQQHNLFIIADETYRDIVFTGKPTSLLKIAAARQRTIVVDSASKRFSLPGARIGVLISCNPRVYASVLRFCMARLSAPTLEQFALVPLLTNPTAYIKKVVAVYKKRRDVVVRELKKIPGVTFFAPAGAFYLTVKLPVADAEDFIKFLLTRFNAEGKTVMVAPLNGFYHTPGLGKSSIRIAYVIDQAQLKTAIDLLKQALATYTK